MPVVPRYQSEVNAAPLQAPGIRAEVPLEAVGGGATAAGLSRTMENAGDVVQRMLAVEKQKADDLMVLNKAQELSKFETDLLYADKTGALNQRGQQVFGMPDRVTQTFGSKIQELEKGLNNDEQRVAFKRIAGTSYNDINRQVQRHFNTEKQQYDSQVTESYLNNERDAAAANYLDPARVNESVNRQSQEIIKHAMRNGLPEDWVHEKVSDSVSKTHVSVISRMLSNELDQQASQYYQTNRDAVSGKDAITLEKALEEGSIRGGSQRQADAIFNSGVDRLAALSEAGKIKDPKLRDETERRLNQKYDIQKHAEIETRNDLYMQATNLVDKSPGRNARDIIPPVTWSQLDLSQRNALEHRAGTGSNDDRAWLDFYSLSPNEIGSMSRADFETKYWYKFDRAHRGEAEKLYKAAQQGPDDPHLTQTLTFKDRVENTLKSNQFIDLHKNRARLNTQEAKLYVQFEDAASHEVEQFERTELGGRRKATGDEIQKVLDKMIVKKVFVNKSWLPFAAKSVFTNDPERPASFLSEDEKGRTYIPVDKIPAAAKRRMENMIDSYGRKVSESKLERAYAASLSGDDARVQAILKE